MMEELSQRQVLPEPRDVPLHPVNRILKPHTPLPWLPQGVSQQELSRVLVAPHSGPIPDPVRVRRGPAAVADGGPGPALPGEAGLGPVAFRARRLSPPKGRFHPPQPATRPAFRPNPAPETVSDRLWAAGNRERGSGRPGERVPGPGSDGKGPSWSVLAVEETQMREELAISASPICCQELLFSIRSAPSLQIPSVSESCRSRRDWRASSVC
ncbi:hypothetical protein chiPu_0011816 [Chiloscyllium punctatum]|uniref:Uncharacterized protein n=1 Tax=Chiloscyllium punctatum TaxID=137246 RepID=A0A401SSG3_CHIPU|nr:hypothetical protein [Chiloscyllium punctatum]